MKNNLKKILILRTERIGDYCITLPALKMVRNAFPDAEIDIVVLPMVEKLAKATPYIDNVFVFDDPFLETSTKIDVLKKYFFNYFKLKSFWKKFSDKNYDLVISFSYRKVGEILLNGVKGKTIISQRGKSYTGLIEIERCVRLLGDFGIKSVGGKASFNVSDKDKKLVKRFMRNNTRIIIHPFTYLEFKNWGGGKWIKLINSILKKNSKASIYLIGGKDDLPRIKKVIEAVDNKRVINLCGKLDILQSYYLIDSCDLLVGIDSFPVHAAELTNTKIITLCGEAFLDSWKPKRGQGVAIKRGSKTSDIGVSDVLDDIWNILNKN